MKIKDYVTNYKNYKVDLTYQRPVGVWSTEDKQCLIDTILKGEPMPLFFFNKNTEEQKHYVVDGQQRLSAIFDFYEDKFKLNKKFSGTEYAGLKYSELDDGTRNKFLDYELRVHILKDYDDEKVRIIFSRLQRGKPLRIGERINALPGLTIQIIRELAKHDFFKKSVQMKDVRYEFYPDAARILFYETNGFRDCGAEAIFKFLDEYQDLERTSQQYKNAVRILNFLYRCFPEKSVVDTHAWILTLYTFIKELSLKKSLTNCEGIIASFIKDFYCEVHNPDMRISDRNLQKFYDVMRGSFSQKIVYTRNEIIKEKFFASDLNVPDIDVKRQLNDDEKQAVWAKNKCQCYDCGKIFNSFKEAEYHHIIRFADGGETSVENIIPLCSCCHNKRHANDKKKISPADELNNDEKLEESDEDEQ